MKKRIFAVAVVAICLSILASTTLAYFTDIGTARNVITSGGVDITIEEWQETPDGLVEYPGQSIAVVPAETVSKIVMVRNHDAQSFVRAKLNVIIKEADGTERSVTADELENIIHLQINTLDWTEKDGWWYYTAAVDTGAATEALLTGVHFDGPNMTNEYQSNTLTIEVIAQAVQTAHNNTDALNALGWPAE